MGKSELREKIAELVKLGIDQYRKGTVYPFAISMSIADKILSLPTDVMVEGKPLAIGEVLERAKSDT